MPSRVCFAAWNPASEFKQEDMRWLSGLLLLLCLLALSPPPPPTHKWVRGKTFLSWKSKRRCRISACPTHYKGEVKKIIISRGIERHHSFSPSHPPLSMTYLRESRRINFKRQSGESWRVKREERTKMRGWLALCLLCCPGQYQEKSEQLLGPLLSFPFVLANPCLHGAERAFTCLCFLGFKSVFLWGIDRQCTVSS